MASCQAKLLRLLGRWEYCEYAQGVKEAACGGCDQPMSPGVRFCSGCGNPVEADLKGESAATYTGASWRSQLVHTLTAYVHTIHAHIRKEREERNKRHSPRGSSLQKPCTGTLRISYFGGSTGGRPCTEKYCTRVSADTKLRGHVSPGGSGWTWQS